MLVKPQVFKTCYDAERMPTLIFRVLISTKEGTRPVKFSSGNPPPASMRVKETDQDEMMKIEEN